MFQINNNHSFTAKTDDVAVKYVATPVVRCTDRIEIGE